MVIVSILVSPSILADDLSSLSFSHLDWDLVCDNTRTCRAVAYHIEESNNLPVSLLLTRKAGPNEPVAATLKLGSYDGDLPITPKSALIMQINGNNIGSLAINPEEYTAQLTPEMIAKLLSALKKNATLGWQWQEGGYIWQVSDRGASAVLLKMDEFQGRLNTPGALVKKGTGDERQVLPALAIPLVTVPALAKSTQEDFKALASSGKLIKALASTIEEESDYCPVFLEGQAEDKLEFYRLNKSQLLVSTICWRAAYNGGSGFWLVNETPPHAPVLITDSGIDYGSGVIFSAHKGRGLGDCFSVDEWAWNGKAFLHTLASTTGRCTLVAAGGAWKLPTRVMTVEQTNK